MTKEELKKYTGCGNWMELWERVKEAPEGVPVKPLGGFDQLSHTELNKYMHAMQPEGIKAAAFDEIYPKLPTEKQKQIAFSASSLVDFYLEAGEIIKSLPTRKP